MYVEMILVYSIGLVRPLEELKLDLIPFVEDDYRCKLSTFSFHKDSHEILQVDLAFFTK